jgi:hypothetical protein
MAVEVEGEILEGSLDDRPRLRQVIADFRVTMQVAPERHDAGQEVIGLGEKAAEVHGRMLRRRGRRKPPRALHNSSTTF